MIASPFDRPRRFEIFRASVARAELFVLVLSDDIPNALRRVVVVSTLSPREEPFGPSVPTRVPLSASATGLAFEGVTSPASPMTIPKNALVERLGRLAGPERSSVDRAIRLTFGYEEWPL
ncbi:MAG: type II toxin-antitoxin system PemK/MazF family toxin [Elusimicrobia bacterium]|nr:type II toxin-antitoxin system PemK/MazF family toxin [Elusimicrobiota bacterium]